MMLDLDCGPLRLVAWRADCYDFGMSNDDLSARRLRLRNIVVMAFADGSLGEREVNLVADHCADLGLDHEDLRRAVEFGLDDGAAIEVPNDQTEREWLMKDLIRMMAADGRLDESEKRLFALVAVKMSMTAADIERLLDQVLGK
jgi:uncharacterized tellurite resistance protein B-like protein